MRVFPVILCGGAGTRLWPASRPSRPKQFLPLIGERSLFQDTVERLNAFSDAPIVVAGAGHVALIREQLEALAVEAVVLVEPEARDSGPAIAAAAAWIARQDPSGVAVVVASDHHIPDAAAFREAIATAAPAALDGAIVTFGVAPARAETAYGYIQPGPSLPDRPGVRKVERFVEKPDPATAERYVADGYLWNSGNFVFSVAALAAELARSAPALAEAAAAAVEQAQHDGPVVRLGEAFRAAPKISFDYAVMEKTADAAVAPVSFDWSDLGAWDSVWAASARDQAGNGVRGAALAVDAKDSLLVSERGPLVVGVGLKRIAVIAEPDAVLVCDLDSAQAVKTAVDALKRGGRPEVAGAPAAGLDLDHWMAATALPVWWALGADHQRGGFHEALALDGVPTPGPRRARVQARQLYVYAAAGLAGWKGPWAAAVAHGLDYFLDRYRRPDGLFRTLVDADGAPADETAMVYDQAFALFGMAAAATALPERAAALTGAAGAVLQTLRRTRAHPGGGFAEAAGPSPFQSNPHMHLLEAALAWEAVDGGGPWAVLADEIVGLALAKFIDRRGALREFFSPDWAPAAGDLGRRIEPGHQFEWAWLLERWGVARGSAEARAAARRLFEVGEGGVDANGVAVNALSDDLSIVDAGARLWPQTERIKAAAILARGEAEPLARTRYRKAQAGAEAALARFLSTPSTPGLWRDKLDRAGRFVEESAPASSFYHIACAILERRAGV